MNQHESNSTLPEWKLDPHQQRMAGVDNNMHWLSQKTDRKNQNGQDQKRRNYTKSKHGISKATRNQDYEVVSHVERMAPTASQSKTLVIQPLGR